MSVRRVRLNGISSSGGNQCFGGDQCSFQGAVRRRPLFKGGPMRPTGILSEVVALRQSRIFSSADAHETHERVARLLQPHTLRQPGLQSSARNYADSIRLPGLSLNAIFYIGESQVEVAELNAYYIVFCLRGTARARRGPGLFELTSRHAIVCVPGDNLTVSSASSCEQFVVRIEPDAIEPYLDSKRGIGLRGTLDLLQPSLRPWLTVLQCLVSDPGVSALISQSPALGQDYQNLFLRLLVSGQSLDVDIDALRSACPAVVRRAELYMESHIAEPLTLPQIASGVGTAVRTLQRTFQQFRNKSPMQSLRQLRLDRARRALCGGGVSNNIAEVALMCGFNHFGRFSAAYLERFRERPSDTLRRARRGIRILNDAGRHKVLDSTNLP